MVYLLLFTLLHLGTTPLLILHYAHSPYLHVLFFFFVKYSPRPVSLFIPPRNGGVLDYQHRFCITSRNLLLKSVVRARNLMFGCSCFFLPHLNYQLSTSVVTRNPPRLAALSCRQVIIRRSLLGLSGSNWQSVSVS